MNTPLSISLKSNLSYVKFEQTISIDFMNVTIAGETTKIKIRVDFVEKNIKVTSDKNFKWTDHFAENLFDNIREHYSLPNCVEGDWNETYINGELMEY